MFVYTKQMKSEFDQKRIVKWISERGESNRSQLGRALQQRTKDDVDATIDEMVRNGDLIARTKSGGPGRPCLVYILPALDVTNDRQRRTDETKEVAG